MGGRALQYASQEMKGDRELCTAAVAQNGRALQYASQEMKGDPEVCLAAIGRAGIWQKDDVFKMMSDGMQKNEQIVLAALDGAGLKDNIFATLSEELQRNDRV